MIVATRAAMKAALWEAGFRVWAERGIGVEARRAEADANVLALCSWSRWWLEDPPLAWVVTLMMPGAVFPVEVEGRALPELTAALMAMTTNERKAAA